MSLDGRPTTGAARSAMTAVKEAKIVDACISVMIWVDWVGWFALIVLERL